MLLSIRWAIDQFNKEEVLFRESEQFSLGVIDEAVYGVKADATPDPLRYFYQRNYSRVGTMFSRELWSNW